VCDACLCCAHVCDACVCVAHVCVAHVCVAHVCVARVCVARVCVALHAAHHIKRWQRLDVIQEVAEASCVYG